MNNVGVAKNEIIDNSYRNMNMIENATSQSVAKKPKLWKVALILVVASAIVIAGTLFFVSNFFSTEKNLKEINSKLSAFNEFILDDYKSQYDDILVRVAAQKNEKNPEKTKILLADITQLQTNLQQNNANKINQLIADAKSKDTSKAYDDEINTMKGYDTAIANLIKENKFASAKNTLLQWNNLVEQINYVYDNYNVSVNQIDFNSFPKIKVYFSIEDKVTQEIPKNLDSRFFYISEKNANNADYLKQTIQKVVQLDQQENLNINMVADVSMSMNNGPLESAKSIMTNFLNEVQFSINDKVELTSFSNSVYTCATFTSDKTLIKNGIDNLQTEDLTALYDALFAAINTTAVQNGAKCVMAFTDGEDNRSRVTPSEVIALAKRYNVPVFIIGVGNNIDTTQLQNIATSTNGIYQNIDNISDMSALYQKIYKKNKQMYLLEYETQQTSNVADTRSIKIDVQTRKGGGGTNYSFEPRPLTTNTANLNDTDEISKLISGYLLDFIDAINTHDYSHIEKYTVLGGGVDTEVRPYILRDIEEKLLSHEIINKEFTDANTCIVTTRETYEILNNYEHEPLHMRVLEAKYVVAKQANGKWLILNFAEKIKVLSIINY